MPTIDIRITNLPQIKAAFGKSPLLMMRELNAAIQRSVLTIGRDSRLLTPVRTGRLRASTYERFSNLRGEVGTNTEYDVFVHEGTRFMRGRPYLRRSVEMNDQSIQSYFTDAVQKVLNQTGSET